MKMILFCGPWTHDFILYKYDRRQLTLHGGQITDIISNCEPEKYNSFTNSNECKRNI